MKRRLYCIQKVSYSEKYPDLIKVIQESVDKKNGDFGTIDRRWPKKQLLQLRKSMKEYGLDLPKLCLEFPDRTESQIKYAANRLEPWLRKVPKQARPYRARKVSLRRWYQSDKNKIIKALLKHGANYPKLVKIMGTRTLASIYNYVWKLRLDLEKEENLNEENTRVLEILNDHRDKIYWSEADR
jgi:hypothetical protein